MLLRKWEMPWRTCYEGYAALIWLACIAGMSWMWFHAPVPHMPFAYLGLAAGLFFVFNLVKSWEILRLKWSLGGKGLRYMSDEEVKDIVDLDQSSLWVGWGFDWTPVHTQRLYEIKRADPEEFYPPPPIMRLMERFTGEPVGANTPGYIGAPWIHGLNAGEEMLRVAIDNFVGNTLLLGTTRCGKTRFLELVAEMAIQLGDTVIVMDPKGDQPFEESCLAACRGAGREKEFVRFHLAFPGQSARIDPLKNYTNPSDLASRISALMPGGDKSSSFRDFAWGVLNAIVLGQLEVGEKPTLVKISSYVDNGLGDLLIRVINHYFDKTLRPEWTEDVAEFARKSPATKGRSEPDTGALQVRRSLNLLVDYYLYELVPAGHYHEPIKVLASCFRHESQHYSKMITNLKPILGQLTTGELGRLLSPDPRDVMDPRAMTDMQSLIRSGSVVYIGLDSLANKAIASQVGAMLLSDLTSVAASIYNYGNAHASKKRIWLIVDEAAEVVNDPYVSMLNKSSGAGFINVAAAQTVPDFAARFESMDKARQMLGNFNNLFAMRVKDRVTQEYCVETFGQTYVTTKQVLLSTSSSTEKSITHFTGAVQERVSETMEDVMPADVLGQLPNWQYIGAVSGGRIIKGRLPIIQHDLGNRPQ